MLKIKPKKSRYFIVDIIAAIIIITILALILRFLEISIEKKIKSLIPVAQAARIDYQAIRVDQNPVEIINLEAGKGITFWVKFKNIGRKNWEKQIVKLKTIDNQNGILAHPTWPAKNTPYIVKWGVPVNTVGTFKFALQAPETNGLYWEKLNLYVNDTQIPGGYIEIGMRVYGGKDPKLPTPTAIQTPSTQKPTTYFWQTIPADYQVVNDFRMAEPEIRVGLFYVTAENKTKYLPLTIKTLNNQPYEVRGNNDYLYIRAFNGDLLEINYDFNINRTFVNANGQRLLMTDEPLRFIPTNPETIFKIDSWQNGPFWGMNVDDDEYRGKLEIRYNPSTQRLWIINELPMEKYLPGVAEVWDSWPFEFLKAQKIAARTYALFRYLTPKYTNTPDEEPIFTVRATQADQVYRGYQSELRNPNIVRVAKETRGMVITHNNDPILAYYFAQSDGQTRDSYQVRMTAAPVDYLKAKSDPPGRGRTLKGHGVGMPQQGGKVAAEQGANFSQILRYYYQGVEIKKLYP